MSDNSPWPCPICGHLNDPELVVCEKTAEHDTDGWKCRTCQTVNRRRAVICRNATCPAAAAARSVNARIAVNTSWARTPIRSERTENARRNSPGRVEYWEAQIRAEGLVAEADIPAAAKNAQAAYMARLVKKRAAKIKEPTR